MIAELDSVVLTRDVPEYRLEKGDIGAVVHRYGETGGLEVEFVTAGGKTVAVLTLTETDVRPVRAGEILSIFQSNNEHETGFGSPGRRDSEKEER